MRSSNRSPSPMSFRSNPNPNPSSISRNALENVDAVRRSFSSAGTKFTKPSFISKPRSFNSFNPANSTAEYSRRSSFGKDGVRDYEQKENEQDLNQQPTRVRSSSVVKGSKNFMSPTISAASKINASPRKKVLGERNESVRTSASLSAGKFHFYSTGSSESEADDDVHDNVLKLKSEICPQTYTTIVASMAFRNESTEDLAGESTINVTVADDDKNEPEPDVVVLSPLNSSKCEPASLTETSSSMIAPLDVVDPLLPPYDPKNNYLSPRPQFLHYKPKPRVGVYVKHGIRLEDKFAPENSFESESSEGIIIQPKKSSKEMPESSKTSEPSDSHLPEERVESEAVAKRKSGFFTWSKAFVFFLVMSLALPLAIYYPSVTDTWNEDNMISNILDESHKVADLAREHLESWCHNLKLKWVQSFSQLSLIIGGFRQVKKLGPLKYLNVTVLHENGGRDYEFGQFKMDTLGEEKRNIKQVDDKTGISGNTEDYNSVDIPEEKGDSESQVVQQEYLGVQELEENSEHFPSIESSAPADLIPEEIFFENSEALFTEQQSLIETKHEKSRQTPQECDLGFEYHVGSFEENQMMQPDYLGVIELEENSKHFPSIEGSGLADLILGENGFENFEALATEQQSLIESKHEESGQTPQENIDSIPDEPETVIEKGDHLSTIELVGWNAELLEAVESLKQLLAESIVATSVLVATLLVATILLCLKFRNHFPQQQEGKSTSKSISSNIKPQTSCSQSGPIEYESCPLETTNVERGTTCSKRGPGEVDAVQSHERNVSRNHKRESTSSKYTTGSPSYGSFTTYSIVHSKHGDQEVVTPLRRSSRIRKKVTHS